MKHDLSKAVFIVSFLICALVFTFTFGVLAHRYNIPPVPQLGAVYTKVSEVLSPSDKIMKATGAPLEPAVETLLPNELQPGLLMVAANTGRRKTVVRIIDRNGIVIHEWTPFWLEIWPDNEGEFLGRRPAKDRYLHGVEVLPDGSLVANFEHLSTFRLSPCGKIIWKLDNLGHHSVHYADDGTIWVSAEDVIESDPTGFPGHKAPLRSWTLQNLSLDGKVLRTIPVIDVLIKNGLEGLLFLSNRGAPFVNGDTLHLNDIEIFPKNLSSDLFEPGDIMFSLRNINGIFVVDSKTLALKFVSVGHVVGQHDPDFIDGDRISVFDNRKFRSASGDEPKRSRVIELDAMTGSSSTVLGEAVSEFSFFTQIMGNHQRLENGNILVVSTGEGRLLEYTRDGSLAWRLDNTVGESNQRIMGAVVLPENQNKEFFVARTKACGGGN